MFSLCTCCRRNNPKSDDGDVYGIVNPSVPTSTDAVDSGSVQFRNGFSKKTNDRHSLPGNSNVNGTTQARISAPGRALPQLPGDLYSAIDKNRKDSIRFVDDIANPTYESIDPDADSFVDPLYSKVGDPTSLRKERKYDYPVFPGRRNEIGPSRQPDETYQSASQIYGSEDPYRQSRHPVVRFSRGPCIYRIPVSPPRVSVSHYYRSITSSRAVGAEYGDEDSSSAYEPGYAKVQNLNQQRLDRIERKEQELDHLYSKISRNPRDPDEEPGPRPAIDLPQVQQELPVLSMFNPGTPEEVIPADSREPSYRYITVRENAERVRERLRQQGQLDPPTREHYYSTIGNEYDTIQGGSSTYGPVTAPTNQSLTVHTDDNSNFAPPPPTSPIPHRLDYTDSQLNERSAVYPPAYATVNKKRNSTPGSSSGWNPLSLSTATSFAGLTRSFNGTTSSCFPQVSPVASSSTNIQGIKEFMQKPMLPYPSNETILGRKIVEERERIVEKRMSQSSTPSLEPAPSTSHVHRVEITRLDGPSVDTIISGRRYRGQSEGIEQPSSARSNLPVAMNRAETSRLSELASQRKQKSLDQGTEQIENRPVVVEKKRTRKDSTSSKNSHLSTIYTANDYVSTMDMTTNDRPWPISREASPSARSEKF